MAWLASRTKQFNPGNTGGNSMDAPTILMDYIKQEFPKARGADIKVEDDLLSVGIVDSLGILQLVTFIEERFGVTVPDEEVVFENFSSVRAMADFVANQQT
jgi:acyl carrier protein